MNDLQRYAPLNARLLALSLVSLLLQSGFALSVNDGQETTVSKSRDMDAILDALATTDADTITAYGGDPEQPGNMARAGSVYLIWENDGDVIADWGGPAGYRNGDRFNALLDSLMELV